MSHPIDLSEIVSSADLTQIDHLFHTHRTRDPNPPKPIAAIGSGGRLLLFRWADIVIWATNTGRDHYLQPRKVNPELVGRKVRPEDIVGLWDITTRLGYANVHSFHVTLKRDPNFPKAILKIGKRHHISLYHWPEVLAWAYDTGRISPRRK